MFSVGSESLWIQFLPLLNGHVHNQYDVVGGKWGEMMARVLLVAGTRPEAIKLAPVAHALNRQVEIETRLCVTGQHRAMVDEVLSLFGLEAQVDLDLPRGGLAPGEFISRALMALGPVIVRERPSMILVQGDTATAFAAALAGFHARVPIGHVEAGLRTDDLNSPSPEEGNRRLIAQLASLHFAPSVTARAALRREGVGAAAIYLVGNTGVDALLAVDRVVNAHGAVGRPIDGCPPALGRDRPLVLVTTHRRENHGARLDSICEGIARVSSSEEADIVIPVHPNPIVSKTVRSLLSNKPNIHLVDPLDYRSFVRLLRLATVALTDSGGIQEEGPALGTPVLVMRDTTERPEGIAAGVAKLVGTDAGDIAAAVRSILRNPVRRAAMSRPMRLYGRGNAADKIARIVGQALSPASLEVSRVAA